MKKILLLIACALYLPTLNALAQLHGSKYQNDLKEENLKGKVKSCRSYFYNDAQTDTTLYPGWVFSYKSNYRLDGNTSTLYIFNQDKPNGFLQREAIFDKEGRISFYRSKSGPSSQKVKYKFDSHRNLTETGYHETGRISYIDIYNRQGLLDITYTYDETGNANGKYLYKYDAKNKLISTTTYDANDKIEKRTQIERDDKGLKKYETTYDSLGVITAISQYIYDDHNNIVMQKDQLGAVRIGGSYNYTLGTGKDEVWVSTYKYYNYDSHGNWLQQDIYEKHTIAKTTKRRIEYYR